MTDDTRSDGPLQVDTDLVRQLAELLNEGDLSEIEVQDGAKRIVVKRNMTAAVVAAAPQAPAASAPVAAAAASPPAAPSDEVAAGNHPGAVKSPMVGTVYLSGEPGAPPYVTAGARVSVGDTLVIVEAMKVMNPIKAERGGVVKQVLVQNGQPVEYDQPLVIIE